MTFIVIYFTAFFLIMAWAISKYIKDSKKEKDDETNMR